MAPNQMFEILLVLVIFIGLSAALLRAEAQKDQLKQRLRRYDALVSREEQERQLNSNILLKQDEIAELANEKEHLITEIRNLRQQVYGLQEEEYVQSFGFYEPKYDFISSGDYALQLKHIKSEQRRLIREKKAAICHTDWVMRDSNKDGQKMTENFLKLALSAFNTDCDDIILRVKHSNVESPENKIKATFSKLNKALKIRDCEITQTYLSLKLRELDFQYELECKKQEEKVKEQAIREEAKQNQKLEKELRKIEEAEERERRYQQELENALQEQALALGQENEQLEHQIQQLRQYIADATSDKEKAISRSVRIKEGYIYIVSNIGSFGRDVYRICMTRRRIDPDEYIGTTNPAVPFPFDIHFKFFSEDASDTLRRLHQRFHNRRVNKANERRDFFRVPLDEIVQAVEETKKETGALKNIQFEKAPQAYEYRRTLAFERKDNQTSMPANEIA
ncbi:MAG: DUF4041 domain-containing protein [Trichocoleus desertorum ATA4-8-CV12]|jgi:hypothetical protein|nr:DUF4041 domain-containing protein [Trichocoleus desertorum ATA4-8-CV12]